MYKAPRVGNKGETSVNSCGPRHPDWETRGRQVQTHAAQALRVGDKGETSVQGTQSGKQGVDKCKLMRPKARRVGDKGETSVQTHAAQGTQSGRQGETSVNSCGPRHPEWETRGRQGETSVNSCGPRHPEWETRGRQVQTHAAQGTQSGRQGGDKCKLMRPKAPRVGDKGKQV